MAGVLQILDKSGMQCFMTDVLPRPSERRVVLCEYRASSAQAPCCSAEVGHSIHWLPAGPAPACRHPGGA